MVHGQVLAMAVSVGKTARHAMVAVWRRWIVVTVPGRSTCSTTGTHHVMHMPRHWSNNVKMFRKQVRNLCHSLHAPDASLYKDRRLRARQLSRGGNQSFVQAATLSTSFRETRLQNVVGEATNGDVSSSVSDLHLSGDPSRRAHNNDNEEILRNVEKGGASWWDISRETRNVKRQRSIDDILQNLEPKLLLGNLKVVLVEPKYSGNVGSVARACANFECIDLVVVNPRCDPKSDEAFKLAAGETFVLHRLTVVPSLNDALADTCGSIAFTRRHGRERPVYKSLQQLSSLHPRYLMKENDTEANTNADIDSNDISANVKVQMAFVFGREDSGLTDEEVLRCQLACMIPTGRLKGSLNLSTAVTLALSQSYEIVSTSAPYACIQEKESKMYDDVVIGGEHHQQQRRRSTDQSFNALMKSVVSLLNSIASADSCDTNWASYKKKKLYRMIKLILARSSVSVDEVNALHGLVSSLKKIVGDDGSGSNAEDIGGDENKSL